MKLTKLALAAASLAIFANANAATLNFSNMDFMFSGNDLLLLDNAGNPLAAGFAALSTTPDATGILADSLVVISAANSPAAGFFNSPLTSANDGSLNGQNLFVVFGNGADAGSSDQLGILDTGLAFSAADTPPPPESIFFTANASTSIVLGSLESATFDLTAVGNPSYTSQALQLVPEPSTSLLAGLAGLGLLIRRKR